MSDEKGIAAIIAANIIYYMDVNHLSRRELADRIGVSLASVGFWCTGTKIPRMDKIDKMCEIFGCTRSNLLNDGVRPVPAHDDSPDARERDLLSVFRRLDERGKRTVENAAQAALLEVTEIEERDSLDSA